MLHETVAVREAVHGPLRHFAAAQQSVAFGGIATVAAAAMGTLGDDGNAVG
jgi:hypothetical protein